MRRRSLFVGVPVVYAFAVYATVSVTQSRADRFEILLLVLALSVAAGGVAWRFADRLEAARAQAERGREELAVVGQLSAGLSGPLSATEVATQFLAGIRAVLPPTAVTILLQYEETAGSIQILAQQGGATSPQAGLTFPVAVLPAAMRTRLIGEHRAFVIGDTAADAEWPALAANLKLLEGARSFAALPLVSRSRLIGLVMLVDPTPKGIGRDQLQLISLLGQYVSGALHNALSIAEADERADREGVVNRISQRIYSNLDPDAVVQSTLEELGQELAVSRAVICSSEPGTDITVLHEWDAPGMERGGVGRGGRTPMAALAAREGRTIAVRNARTDLRLAEPALGSHELIEQGTVAGIATPIGVGVQAAGILLLHQVGEPRAWTSQDIRLRETVARQLRISLEAARLLIARQRESERMLALHRASALVAGETDPADVIREVLEAAAVLLGRGNATLYRWDEHAQRLRHADSARVERGAPPLLRSGEGVSGQAFATQKPVIVNDYANCENPVASTPEAGRPPPLPV